MAQEMDSGIKRVASSNPLQVRNNQMMLPSDVYSVTSMNGSGESLTPVPGPVLPKLPQVFLPYEQKKQNA